MRFYPFVSTGKERDEETGYGYFGARYMDHELMTMWLSVDPMADKYPSISPYAYCAWNPVKLIDPDGREVGDYYNMDGKYLGWDGKEDDNVYIIENNHDQYKIESNDRKDQTTRLDELESSPIISTTYTALSASIDVHYRTQSKDNGGRFEESSLVDGRCIYIGERGTENNAKLPNPSLEVSYMTGISIHSHRNDNNAEYPGPQDPLTFSHYHQNIIVGPIATISSNYSSSMVKGETRKEPGLAFYPSLITRGQSPNATLSLHTAEKIANQQTQCFFKHTVGRTINHL